MANVSAANRTAVLTDLLPGTWVRDGALVAGAALLTGIAAQVSIPLPGTLVPFTLQTFAVLLSAAALGPVRAALGMLLYLGLGQAGLPWFAPDGGNATVGYIVGFVVAGAVTGALARRGGDRTPLRTFGTIALGTVLIYVTAVPWLMVATGASLGAALAGGVVPFILGDTLKALAAAGLLPAAWKLVERRDQDR
ncbi:biotin transporter BioY [Spongiactinospora sp. TRM90649]|uniref:biotin transporter BioY n=1 Tax=Spongiactinospora sp. TRM90649 TaxID=3031114 RepID=UPI0023F72979|nr:biotin transporter BioY [Spongiactinospora sp. TRM90649]MDF5755475.1 biotin transporter BioY [Spongiactinospora sp. TRM90649]